MVGDYDPTTGTFLTRDPLDGLDGTPTTANPYHYADNDPLNKTDPLGLRPDDRCASYDGEVSGQEQQDCEVIQGVLDQHVPSWRGRSFKIYADHCGGHIDGTLPGQGSGQLLCVSWRALSWQRLNGSVSTIYSQMTSDMWSLYIHTILHEYGHVVNSDLYVGEFKFWRWMSNDNDKGWPAINDIDTWAELLVGTTDEHQRAALIESVNQGGDHAFRDGSGRVKIDEFLADCVAQGLFPSVLGGYWLRDVDGNEQGRPFPGRTAAVRYVHGG